MDCCGQKIQYFLDKEHRVDPEVIRMDSIDFGGIFAFTAVDIFSKEADVTLAPELTSQYGADFLDYRFRYEGTSRKKLVPDIYGNIPNV